MTLNTRSLSRRGLAATGLAIIGMVLSMTGGIYASEVSGATVTALVLPGTPAMFLAVWLLLGVIVTLLRAVGGR